MASKGISEFIHCIRCGGEESLLHVIRDCSWVKDSWAAANIPFLNGFVSSFKDIIEFVWSSCGSPETEKLATICWQIWKCRNDMIFRNINTPPLICIGKVVAWLKEYHNAVCFHLPVSKHSRDQERWCGPPRGVIKINFDGACGGEGDRLGLGFVAREYAGKSLMTGSKTLYEDSAEDFEIRALS